MAGVPAATEMIGECISMLLRLGRSGERAAHREDRRACDGEGSRSKERIENKVSRQLPPALRIQTEDARGEVDSRS
jgi:hypothetical protein